MIQLPPHSYLCPSPSRHKLDGESCYDLRPAATMTVFHLQGLNRDSDSDPDSPGLRSASSLARLDAVLDRLRTIGPLGPCLLSYSDAELTMIVIVIDGAPDCCTAEGVKFSCAVLSSSIHSLYPYRGDRD